MQGRRLWCGWYGHGRTTFELEQQYINAVILINHKTIIRFKTDLLAKRSIYSNRTVKYSNKAFRPLNAFFATYQYN